MRDNGRDTLLTLNTRTGVKKSKYTNYSSYWMDFDDDDDVDSVITAKDILNPERIIKLASVRRATANFVRILTGDSSIKVNFSSGKESYTDGKNVVIAAEDDSKHFDSMVGLALHEGSHCLLSDFNFLQNIIGQHKEFNFLSCLSDKLIGTIPNTYSSEGISNVRSRAKALQQVMQTILNVIEDRRIDTYVYQNAAGYRPYYQAMYTKYFYNADITKNLKSNPEWRTPTVENYVNWLIHIFHPDFDRNALPGLSEIVDMIDLRNIRRFDADKKMPKHFTEWTFDKSKPTPWKGAGLHIGFENPYMVDYSTLPSIWHTVNDITLKIIQYVGAANLPQKGEGEGEGIPQVVEVDIDGLSFGIDPNELPNLDTAASSQVVGTGRYNEKKAKKAMDNIKKVMKGENRRKKLTRKEADDVKQLESADAKICEAGDKIIGNFPCLVTRKITKEIMMSEWFPFASATSDYMNPTPTLTENRFAAEAVRKGFQMGQMLVHRLQVRNDPTVTTFTRQEHGRIDRRILAQLGMDIEQVFKRTTVDTFRPVMLHLSLDASGSMGGDKWGRCIAVATALAYVSSKIRNVETVITIRGDHNIPIVAVVYDSRKDNFQKVRSLFPYLHTNGSTPEGLCFKATLDLITECAVEYDTYFINFSDGEPGTTVHRRGEYRSYGGQDAVDHTRRQVQAMREAGVKILSYFIAYSSRQYGTYSSSAAVSMFRKMYGEDATFVNVENVSDVLRTLNKLLLRKGA